MVCSIDISPNSQLKTQNMYTEKTVTGRLSSNLLGGPCSAVFLSFSYFSKVPSLVMFKMRRPSLLGQGFHCCMHPFEGVSPSHTSFCKELHISSGSTPNPAAWPVRIPLTYWEPGQSRDLLLLPPFSSFFVVPPHHSVRADATQDSIP